MSSSTQTSRNNSFTRSIIRGFIVAGITTGEMMKMSELRETVAKNVGVSLDTLNGRIEEVLSENRDA